MKTAIYHRANGVIQQVCTGPDESEWPDIDGLSVLVLDGSPITAGKIIANGELVDGVIDDRTPTNKLQALQSSALALLAASDWIVYRSYERQEPVPPAWATYREALREIIRMTVYRDIDLPTPPT